MYRVAIITRTLERPELLERTVESVLAQTFGDWQLVITNLGRPEPVEKLIARFSDRAAGRITHLPFSSGNPRMRGAPLNAAIRATQSQFITVLDDDDTWDPAFLAESVAALHARPFSNVRGVTCRSRCIEESSVSDGLQMLRTYEFNEHLRHVSIASMAVCNSFCINAFVYERAAFEEVGGYPEDCPVLEDWHFNLRFCLNHEIAVIPKTLANYHLRADASSAAESNSTDHETHRIRLINEAIRKDISSGKPGLGHILLQAEAVRGVSQEIRHLEAKHGFMSAKIGRIDARTKVLKDGLLKKGK